MMSFGQYKGKYSYIGSGDRQEPMGLSQVGPISHQPEDKQGCAIGFCQVFEGV